MFFPISWSSGPNVSSRGPQAGCRLVDDRLVFPPTRSLADLISRPTALLCCSRLPLPCKGIHQGNQRRLADIAYQRELVGNIGNGGRRIKSQTVEKISQLPAKSVK